LGSVGLAGFSCVLSPFSLMAFHDERVSRRGQQEQHAAVLSFGEFGRLTHRLVQCVGSCVRRKRAKKWNAEWWRGGLGTSESTPPLFNGRTYQEYLSATTEFFNFQQGPYLPLFGPEIGLNELVTKAASRQTGYSGFCMVD